MSFQLWLTFVAASTVLLMIPGPTVLLVLSYALSQGRRVALATAATDSFTTPWTDGIAALTLLAVSIFAGSMLRGVSAQADIAGADRVGRIHARPKPSLPAGLIEAEVGEFGAG